MKPTFFSTQAELRRWLEAHHGQAAELWIGFHKRASGMPSVSYQEALDEALCFGWIDGVRKSLGETSYVIRFTPRRAKSIWSQVNITRAEELTKLGRMTPPGLRAFAAREATLAKTYSYENRPRQLDQSCEAEFRAHPAAWAFFSAQPAGYRRTVSFWVMSAKQEATRRRRLAQLIASSAKGERYGVIGGPAKKQR